MLDYFLPPHPLFTTAVVILLSRFKQLYRDAFMPTKPHGNIPHPASDGGAGTPSACIQAQLSSGSRSPRRHCVMCADVPLRPWHFGRNAVRDRHSVSLSDLVCLPPHARNMVWQHVSISFFGLRSRHPSIPVCKDVGIRMVHEVSGNDVSHSHLGTVLDSRRDTGLNKSSTWQSWSASHAAVNVRRWALYITDSDICVEVVCENALHLSFHASKLAFQGIGTTTCQPCDMIAGSSIVEPPN